MRNDDVIEIQSGRWKGFRRDWNEESQQHTRPVESIMTV